MKKSNERSLGSLMKDARKSIGMSQRELAKILKVSDKAVSAYEVNRAKPSFETLKKIGKLTNRPISYFDYEKGEEDEEVIELKLSQVERELREIKALLKKKKQ